MGGCSGFLDSVDRGRAAARRRRTGRRRRRARPASTSSGSRPSNWKAERRAVVICIARARVPIRQAAAARQVWIQDLSKVYEAIRTSPTGLILERAGEVGYRHEPAFREALSLAQALTPPPPCEAVHDALIGWLTSLHAACLSLMDARRLRDRSLLGNFRENLSQARRQAADAGAERANLFTVYRLRVRPTIQRRHPRATADAPRAGERRPRSTGGLPGPRPAASDPAAAAPDRPAGRPLAPAAG